MLGVRLGAHVALRSCRPRHSSYRRHDARVAQPRAARQPALTLASPPRKRWRSAVARNRTKNGLPGAQRAVDAGGRTASLQVRQERNRRAREVPPTQNRPRTVATRPVDATTWRALNVSKSQTGAYILLACACLGRGDARRFPFASAEGPIKFHGRQNAPKGDSHEPA
jgi:hypothetical protein